jgi:hypothetical protein
MRYLVDMWLYAKGNALRSILVNANTFALNGLEGGISVATVNYGFSYFL